MDIERLKALLATLPPEEQQALLQQLTGGQQMGGLPPADALPPGPEPTPEELQALAASNSIPQRSQIVQDQLAQADALRNADVGNFSTPGGAALGGLGNVIGKIQGGIETNQLRGQQQDLLGQDDAVALQLLKAKQLRGRPPATAQGNAAAGADVYGALGDIFGGFGGF